MASDVHHLDRLQILPNTGGISPGNLAHAMLDVYSEVGPGALVMLSSCSHHALTMLVCPRPDMLNDHSEVGPGALITSRPCLDSMLVPAVRLA